MGFTLKEKITRTPFDGSSSHTDNATHKAHDHFFHAVFEDLDISKQMLKSWLPPELVKQCLWETLNLEDKGLYNSVLHEKTADCIFSLHMKNEKEVKFFVHIEHLSSPKRWSILYSWEVIIEYLCKLRNKKKVKALPLIIPIILYQNEKKFPYSTDFCDLFEDPELARKYWMKPIKILNICQTQDEDLIFDKDDRAAFAQLIMKYVALSNFDQSFQEIISPLMRKLHLKDAAGSKRLMKQAVQYMYKKANFQNKVEFATMIGDIDKDLEDTVLSLAQQNINEGRLIGLQEGELLGLEKGRMEGQKVMILRMLQKGASYQQITDITGLSLDDIELMDDND